MNPEGGQKRREFRWNLAVPVSAVHMDRGVKVQGYTDNLSAGGCLLTVAGGDPSAFVPGCLCEIDLGLPDGKVFLLGRVVRKGTGPEGNETIAFEFASVAPGDRDRIARLVLNAEVRARRVRGEETGPGGGSP